MPRTTTRASRPQVINFPEVDISHLTNLFDEKVQKAANTTTEVKKKTESITRLKGFHFYIETTLSSPFVDRYSSKPREYFVENEATKERVALPDALKIGMIGKTYIATEMYEFIHEYDKNLD